MVAKKQIELPKIHIDYNDIKSGSEDVSKEVRLSIGNVLSQLKLDGTMREQLCMVLASTEELFDKEKINTYISENILNEDQNCGENFYYRKIIEDLFNEYVFNNKQKFPDYLSVNGGFGECNHLMLGQMLKLIAIPEEELRKAFNEEELRNVKDILSVIHVMLYAIQKRSSIEKKEDVIRRKAMELIDAIDGSIKRTDRRVGNPNSYSNNKAVKQLNNDLADEKQFKTRYLIDEPITLKSNKKNYDKTQIKYFEDSIEIQSISFREKSIRRQILNSLGGKSSEFDTIGIRVATKTMKGAFNFYRSVIKNDDLLALYGGDVKKTADLVDFEGKNSNKFERRMNQLIEIENQMEHNTSGILNNIHALEEIENSSSYNNIKEVLDSLGDSKNKVFDAYKTYESFVKGYYKLLKEASKLRPQGTDKAEYIEAMEKSVELNKRAIEYRNNVLNSYERGYNDALLHWRNILIVEGTMNSAVTVGKGEKEKLKPTAKSFIKFIVKSLGGEDKLINMNYEKKKNRAGSSLYLSSKIQIDMGDGVNAEMAALPTWMISLGE